MSLSEQILKSYKHDVSELTLIPSDGGKFEVSLDGDLAFSKLKEGRFPEFDEIKPKMEEKL